MKTTEEDSRIQSEQSSYELNAPAEGLAMLNTNMFFEDYQKVMAEQNLGAISLLKKMPLIDYALLHYLDNYGVRGEKLWCLYDKCCSRDYKLFKLTMQMFGDRCFSQKDIDENLGPDEAFFIPFIDDETLSQCLDQDIGPENGNEWLDFRRKNTEIFIQKIKRFREIRDRNIAQRPPRIQEESQIIEQDTSAIEQEPQMLKIGDNSFNLHDEEWLAIAKKRYDLERNPSLGLYASMVYGFAKHLPYSMDIEQPEYIPADFLNTEPLDADYSSFFKYEDSRTFFRSLTSFHETFESGIILQICFIFQKMILGEFPYNFEIKDSDYYDWGIDEMTSNQEYNRRFFNILKTLPTYYKKVITATSNAERRKHLEEMYNKIELEIARLWGGSNNYEYSPEEPPAIIEPYKDVVLKINPWGITYYDGITEIIEQIKKEQLKKYKKYPHKGFEQVEEIESSIKIT